MEEDRGRKTVASYTTYAALSYIIFTSVSKSSGQKISEEDLLKWQNESVAVFFEWLQKEGLTIAPRERIPEAFLK